MKPNELLDVSVSGTMTGEVIPMDVDPDAKIHMMTVFTNLYSDRLLACIREYSTNALDANREAGVDTPIRVSTPNFMSPYLIIADDGSGLTLPQIRQVYSKYLSSTKRDSNDFNGMLGVGSKAALTYTPNFTVISVAEGMRHVVSVSLNEDGVGEMQVVDSTPTIDSSGVTIQIPIARADQYAVKQKAAEFFSWWDEGTVLVDGAPPARKDFTHITGNIYTSDTLSDDYIVMAGIAYPIPGERKTPDGMPRLVYFAETGEINFAPSREAIRYDARAKKVIDRVVKEYTNNFTVALQAEIDACPDHSRAWWKARRLRYKYHAMNLEFTYKGDEVPVKLNDEFKFFLYSGEGATVSPSSSTLEQYINNYYRLRSPNRDGWVDDVALIIGAPKNMSPYNRGKLRGAVGPKMKGPQHMVEYMLLDGADKIDDKWFSGFSTFTWDEVNKHFSEARKAAKAPRDRACYEMYDQEGAYEGERTTNDKEKYLVFPAAKSRHPRREAEYWLKELGFDYLVRLPANRENKFFRLHPESRRFYDAVKDYADNWISSIPKERLLSLAVRRYIASLTMSWILDERDNFEDPVIRKYLNAVDEELDSPYEEEYARIRRVIPSFENTTLGADVEFPPFLKGLPRLTWMASRADNLEIYNALYHYRKGKK